MGSKNNGSWSSFPPDFSIWLAMEESFIRTALMGNLPCWQLILTAPTSTATPEAVGEKRYPSLQQLGRLPQIVLASAAPSPEVAECHAALQPVLRGGLEAQLSVLRITPQPPLPPPCQSRRARGCSPTSLLHPSADAHRCDSPHVWESRM